MKTVGLSVRVDASPERVFAVITDYAAYPEFLGEISQAVVVRREGAVADVAFTLQLVVKLQYTLRLVEDRARSVRWTLLSGDFHQNEGSWILEREADGTTMVRYDVRVATTQLVPGAVQDRLVNRHLPATLAAFKSRAESKEELW